MRTLFASGPQHGRAEWRFIHIVEIVCLTVGMLCLGWFAYNWIATEVDQRWADYQLESALRGQEPSVPGFVKEEMRSRSGEAAPDARDVPDPGPRPRILPGGVIGRVEVPRLKISAVVRSGVDDKTLKRAVGHVPKTALPGEPGNVGIAAHRDTFFRNLKGVKVGDVIRMVTPSGTYEYAVQSLKIVLPRNIEVLDPTPEPALTMVTCYPFNYVGSAPKRFIVRAKQVSPAITAGQRHTEKGM
jgi:sortase A